MRRMRLLALLAVGVIATAACSSSGGANEQPGVVAGAVTANVAFEPGAVAEGQLVIDGNTVDYVTVAPVGFSPGDTAPVLLAFPPGGQDFGLTRSIVEQTYQTEATGRGWVVFSPAAPVGGPLWYDGSETLIPAILDWIETWVEPEGGSVNIAGVSNGGLSTFAVAALVPDRVQSLLVFPGFPRSAEARDALSELVDVPVRMFVGGDDTAWIDPMRSAFDTLTELGGDVTFEIVADEGHIIDSLRDGVRVFDELDANRSTADEDG